MSPSELARHLEITPQTVNRWRNGQMVPRPTQARKLEAWVVKREKARASQTAYDLNMMGIRLAEEILKLETEAKVVWVVKSGLLREANGGLVGESVLQGLRNGAHFRYLFLPHSPAAQSFKGLASWLETENWSGTATGYSLTDAHLATAIGLSEAPGAWIGIEYSTAQIQKLGRRFDVFFALGVREYADAARTQVKNEDGQPIWLELGAPQAARWLETLQNLTDELGRSRGQKQAKIIEVSAEKS